MNLPLVTRRRLVAAEDKLAQTELLLRLCNERVARRDKVIAELRIAFNRKQRHMPRRVV